MLPRPMTFRLPGLNYRDIKRLRNGRSRRQGGVDGCRGSGRHGVCECVDVSE